MSSEQEKSDGKKLKIMDYVRELETKGNVKHSSIELLKSVAVTGAGIYIGSVVGRPALVLGLIPTFAGYYLDTPKLTQFGVGLMATGGFQLKEKGFQGVELEGMEGIKERAKQVTDSLKYSLYLDKIFKGKGKEKEKEKKEETTGDLGEVQYFNYTGGGETNMGTLEAIEDAITESGERFAERQMAGRETDEDFSGIEERLY